MIAEWNELCRSNDGSTTDLRNKISENGRNIYEWSYRLIKTPHITLFYILEWTANEFSRQAYFSKIGYILTIKVLAILAYFLV